MKPNLFVFVFVVGVRGEGRGGEGRDIVRTGGRTGFLFCFYNLNL